MACQTLAKVLRRSVGHPDAPPITSFQLRYPRIIHAESKTHRVLSETEFEPETPGLMNDPSLSRNARSSRAVPVPRLIQEVMDDPFIPRYWGKNEKGMQASEENDAPVMWLDELNEPAELRPEEAWLRARDHAVEAAQAFHDAGYHKQVVNRLIEPFMHIDVVVTGTQWDNFFALRDHEMAEPHIRDLAVAMKEALAEYGEPQRLQPGEWHMPYVSTEDMVEIGDATNEAEMAGVKVSVTRCAQVSYTPSTRRS
ncbi:hypothetical protein ACFQWF_01425 [Methylorubrum suomiense]